MVCCLLIVNNVLALRQPNLTVKFSGDRVLKKIAVLKAAKLDKKVKLMACCLLRVNNVLALRQPTLTVKFSGDCVLKKKKLYSRLPN